MAGVSGSKPGASRRVAETSTDMVDQGQATSADAPQGDTAAAPEGEDGAATSSTPAVTDGAAAPATASTEQATQIAELLDRVAALTADNADLQARLASEQARSAADQESVLSRPSLDALLAGQVDKTVWRIAVVGPAQGRWRIGRRFGPEEQTFVEGELSDDELEALRADPLLTIGVSQVRIQAAEAM